MKKKEYHLEGIRENDSRWIICGDDRITDIREARRKARDLVADGKYKAVEIYVYDRKVVDIVK